MDEKRKYVRVPLVVKVTNKSTREFHFFYSKDISIGGIFLETRDPYPMGAEVELDFFLQIKEKKERLTIPGRVARVQVFDVLDKDAQPPGMGIQFGRVEPAQMAVIGNFIRDALD